MAIPGFSRPVSRTIAMRNLLMKFLESDALMIITEWQEFFNLDYTGKIVIDGRNVKRPGVKLAIYEGICW